MKSAIYGDSSRFARVVTEGCNTVFLIHITTLTVLSHNLLNFHLEMLQITIFNFDFLKTTFSALLSLESYKNVMF